MSLVSGSTKLYLWFTLRCLNPSFSKIVVCFPVIAEYRRVRLDPLFNNVQTCLFVSYDFSQVRKKRKILVVLQTPPNTHWLSITLPHYISIFQILIHIPLQFHLNHQFSACFVDTKTPFPLCKNLLRDST